MDKHWLLFRESERKPLGEDFSGRMQGQEALTERAVRASHWQERIIQGLTQMFTGPDDQIPHAEPLRQDV
jgi:hypothetical protein